MLPKKWIYTTCHETEKKVFSPGIYLVVALPGDPSEHEEEGVVDPEPPLVRLHLPVPRQ